MDIGGGTTHRVSTAKRLDIEERKGFVALEELHGWDLAWPGC